MASTFLARQDLAGHQSVGDALDVGTVPADQGTSCTAQAQSDPKRLFVSALIA